MTNQARAESGVVVLRKGEAAPSNGVFYPNDEHAKLVAKLKSMEATCIERIDYAVKVSTIKITGELNKWKIEAEYWKHQLKLSEDFVTKQRDMLLKQVAKTSTVPWYRSPWFVATTSVIVTIGVVALSVWSFGKLTENR